MNMQVTANFSEIPPPPSPDPGPQCGGADWQTGCSPIVINFEQNDYNLTGWQAPVWFDMSGSGVPVRIGWTAAGADEAFLWLDRDHNGEVTSGAELFGNFTRLKSGQFPVNGFEALKEFDGNGDNVIDANDAIWSQLQLWRDLNHDGVSQASEITSLADSGVVRIELDYHPSGRHDKWGNVFRYASKLWLKKNGAEIGPQPLYDIFFVVVK